MNEEIPSVGARSALRDVTNQVAKRGFSLISGVKSGDDCTKEFAKKECRRVESFEKGNNIDKETVVCVLRPHLDSEIALLKGGVKDTVSKTGCEIDELGAPDVRHNGIPVAASVVKGGDVVGDSSQARELVHATPLGENGPDVIVDCDEDERTDLGVKLQVGSKVMGETSVDVCDGNDVSVDNLDTNKDEFIDCSRLLESQESKCELERCVGQTGDGLSSMDMDVDMIKACPCSFCTKAANLWSGILYQDIKGRIAVIKKSQKEAANLVNRNSRDVPRNFERFSNLEVDLTGRWKSLFLHMEDIFVREETQLERSLSTLKELIDDCKTDSDTN